MLVKFKEILTEKIEQNRAVGSFNTMNLEITQGIVRGAVKADLPVSIQITENVINYAGLGAIYNLTKEVIEAESRDVPITIHLDHGKNLEVVKRCIDIGFSSVHMDASEFAFEDNIKLTKEAAEYGHAQGVMVQGELGNIYGKEGLIKMQQGEDLKKLMTNPEQIIEFIERTKVDTIAISIGNLHGHFVGQENLDFERLEKIHNLIKTPIVLHGGSGIPDDQIKQAIKLGIRIINVDTDLRMAFARALRDNIIIDKEMVDPRKILAPAVAAISQTVKNKAELFNLS